MTRRGGLLVADECHRYASVMNRLALDQRFERRLGLSATYARDDDGHVNWLDPFFRGTCFRMGYRRAVDDGVTAHFTVALVGVELPASERAIYEELTSQIGHRHARLMQRYQLPTASFGQFIQALNLLASGVGSDAAGASEAAPTWPCCSNAAASWVARRRRREPWRDSLRRLPLRTARLFSPARSQQLTSPS